MLLKDYKPEEPSIMVLLNGPVVGRTPDGNEVLFGGMHSLGSGKGVFEVADGDPPLRVQGLVVFFPGVLNKVLKLGGLEVVQKTTVDDITKVPSHQRWHAAGGTVISLSEASAAAAGDRQRRKWYRRFLGLELKADVEG